MRNQLVYDLPVRLFHWIFAGLFVGAFLIAKTVDDESPLFSYHMLAGLLLVFTVLLRIVWGFVGSAHSRFSSFALKPQELVAYFSGILSGEKRRWAGHNPASSWATFAMFALALGLGTTGYLMASGSQETFEDVHELMANGFLVVVLLHVAGVLLHGFRHHDGIGFSMVDGRKMDVPALKTISSSKSAVALVFVILVVVFAGYLVRNFDGATSTLKLFGTTLTLGEKEDSEGQENGEARGGSEGEERDGDDD
jgi:cytochrome b